MAGITGDRTKIKLGPQKIRFGASGSEVNLGFTSGDTVALYTPTYREIMVNQIGSPVDLRIVKEEFVVRGNWLEIDRDNLLTLCPGASAASGAASAAGADFGRRPGYSVAQNASGVLIVHPQDLDDAVKTFDFTIPIAVSVSPLELLLKADEETPMKFEFRAIADPAREDGQHLFRFGY